MIWKPLWIRGLKNQQGRATKEATSPLYFGCLNTITNTPVFCKLQSTILWRQITWNIYVWWQHEANGLNQDMRFRLSIVKRFEKSNQMSKLQYLSSWSILHSPYSRKNIKGHTISSNMWLTGCWSYVKCIHIQGCMFSTNTFISRLRE